MRAVDVLADALRAAEVTAVFGAELDGIDVRLAPSDVAAMLAMAYPRIVLGRFAAQHLGDRTLRFGSGEPGAAVVIDDVGEIPLAVADAVRSGDAVDVVLDIDLAAAAAVAAPPMVDDTWGVPDAAAVEAITRAERPLGLAGPGILTAGHVAGLRSLTLAANLGMLNTWGAKGVLHWQSAHHLATIGLQAEDFLLSGFAEADVIVTSALDGLESPDERWRIGAAQVVDIVPSRLAATAEVLRRPHTPITMPPLRERLAGVTAAGWNAVTGLPMPSALTRVYAEVVGGSGTVVADPGIAGFLAARTTGTARPGGVVVPAAARAGFAVAAAIVSALAEPWRRVVAIVDDVSPAITERLIDVARQWSLPLVVEVWNADGHSMPVDEHRRRLQAAFAGRDVHVKSVATDGRQLQQFLDAAGPIVAWRDSAS